jgi:uroporphyrinogen III methyltransferase / synthase
VSTTSTRKKPGGKPVGSVAFVGAGPGDEALLTLRAAQRLGEAEVVILDQLPRGTMLALHARSGVEVLDAGFGEDGQPMTRAARAKLVVQAAKAGRKVVRLMDGDPATFTGLAEEIAACRKDGVPFEVVPGVSAATAVPAYAGVPLTPAGVSSVHLVHPNGAVVDWATHADPHSTVVVLGLEDDLAAAASGLLDAGRKPVTPVVLTAQGTTVNQQTVSTTLAEAEKTLRRAGLPRPAARSPTGRPPAPGRV